MIILFLVNDPLYFVSHRLPIAIYLKCLGHDVHVAAYGKCPPLILGAGLTYHNVALTRKGKNLFVELKSILEIIKLMAFVMPDLVHLVTVKPYLYGALAARITKVPSVVSAVAGLGILFTENNYRYKWLRMLLYPIFKIAFGHKNQKVIFQNQSDKEVLTGWGVLNPSKAVVIRGAGVAIDDYPFLPEPDGVPVVSFASRLLKDKGVFEFVEASRILKERGVFADFILIGEVDNGNEKTVTLKQLDIWEKEGLVKILGFRKDISNLFSQSNIVALPSFYGEGLPKVLIEAAACGRAIVTTDHPGCRDAIEPNVTGLIVPIKNAEALADALERLIQDSFLRKKMGKAGRALAEREFTIEKVVSCHLEIYEELRRAS